MKHHQENASWLALLPIFTTLWFYGLPHSLQTQTAVQFLPQAVAYCSLVLWTGYNTSLSQKLGLTAGQWRAEIGWGCLTGVMLGILNTGVILWGIPAMGGEIEFLKDTPHAKVPTLFMVPWGILIIALAVEVNFRGFLLERLIVIGDLFFSRQCKPANGNISPGAKLGIPASALLFAFDPFMVMTFGFLHWIAVWDGLVWGWLRVRRRSVYPVIVAHALEVMIMYLSLKSAFT